MMVWATNNSKRVPTSLRDACLARDGHQCTATLKTGERCRETTKLEADHVIADHLGGATALANLQTLCTWHHRQKTQTESAAARRKHPPPPRTYPRERSPGLQ